MTPLVGVESLSASACPCSTTSASSLNVSGTMPLYDASMTCPASPTRAVVLHLEPVFERVGLDHDRAGHDVAVQLQRLAFPLLRVGHHFVDVLEVLGAFAQRRPQQAGKARSTRTDGPVDADLDISMCHKDFRER